MNQENMIVDTNEYVALQARLKNERANMAVERDLLLEQMKAIQARLVSLNKIIGRPGKSARAAYGTGPSAMLGAHIRAMSVGDVVKPRDFGKSDQTISCVRSLVDRGFIVKSDVRGEFKRTEKLFGPTNKSKGRW